MPESQPYWQTFKSAAVEAMTWADNHSGLGSWVGAIGAVAAILFTWWLASSQYHREIRKDNLRFNSEIDLISKVVDDFESLYGQYAKNLNNGSNQSLYRFHLSHLNDPEMHSMSDLAHISVNQWPSIASYVAFKRYWFSSLEVLKSSDSLATAAAPSVFYLNQHDTSLTALRTALTTARK